MLWIDTISVINGNTLFVTLQFFYVQSLHIFNLLWFWLALTVKNKQCIFYQNQVTRNTICFVSFERFTLKTYWYAFVQWLSLIIILPYMRVKSLEINVKNFLMVSQKSSKLLYVQFSSMNVKIKRFKQKFDVFLNQEGNIRSKLKIFSVQPFILIITVFSYFCLCIWLEIVFDLKRRAF